jgi:hypothetical protein
MADELRQEVRWHRAEIRRLRETMAKIQSDSFYGERRAEILRSMQTTLEHFERTLKDLEQQLA